MTAGDLQSGVSVTGNAITGTLNYQGDTSKALVHDWGAGYFLAVKFGGFSGGLTYEDVQVGLAPSAGSGLVTLDSDCNGVFKISDKDTQVLKVVQSDGTHTLTQTFDLSGLTIAAPSVDVLNPSTATFDLNESGADHNDKAFTLIPATVGTTIVDLLDDEDDPIQSESGSHTLWSVDDAGLVITLTAYFLNTYGRSVGTGNQIALRVKLSNNEFVDLTIIIEDTT